LFYQRITIFLLFSSIVSCNPNQVQRCTHTLSQEAIDAMFKSKAQVKCPVAGCSGLWVKTQVGVDQAFSYKYEQFKKQQTLKSQILGEKYANTQPGSFTQPAISLEDD
jgi:hypothetical protein